MAPEGPRRRDGKRDVVASESKGPEYHVSRMIAAIDKIDAYLKCVSREELMADRMRLDAVIFNLEVIGLAANYLPRGMGHRLKDVDWDMLRRLRWIPPHDETGGGFGFVWDVARDVLPGLRRQLEEGLRDGTLRGRGSSWEPASP